MFFRIVFKHSRVPFKERASYLERLNNAAAGNKYIIGRAYIPENCADYEIVVKDEIPADTWLYNDDIRSILRELKKRGCEITDLAGKRFTR